MKIRQTIALGELNNGGKEDCTKRNPGHTQYEKGKEGLPMEQSDYMGRIQLT
jgi:hypothetical protein